MSRKYTKTIDFTGVAITFFMDVSDPADPAIFYSAHSTMSDNPSTDSSWRDPVRITFPNEVYTVGREVLTVRMAQSVPLADADFCVVSDNAFIYVFRAAPTGTIYCDKFVYDGLTGQIVNATQVRYRRSRKADIPVDRKDTFGHKDMNDRLFLEPTVELSFLSDVMAGRFTVAILPTELTGQTRWQFFVQHTGSDSLTGYSILRSADGGFDLEDCLDPDTGVISPSAVFALHDKAQSALSLQAPADLIRYDQQEWQEDEYGKVTLQKREIRALLAVPVGPDSQLAFVDFGIGRDGRLTGVGDAIPVAQDAVLQSALRLDPSIAARVAFPAIATGATMTIAAWIKPTTLADDWVQVVASADDADVPFTLGLEGGVPYLFGPGGVVVAADGALSVTDWTYLAAVWDGTKASLVVNGQVFSAANGVTGSRVDPPATGLTLGGSQGFTGDICALRLWKTARDQAQVLSGMNRVPGPDDPDWGDLVGLWPCNEPDDATRFTTLANAAATGAAADGTLRGAKWVSSTAPVTITGKPVLFDANGLTVCSGLVGYVATTARVCLHEGGDSLIHVYFSDKATGAAMAAQYSPIVARASYGVPWLATAVSGDAETGYLRFAARVAGSAMGNPDPTKTLIAIKPQKNATCQVTLQSYTGYKEVWPAVPADLVDFAKVLNGRAQQKTDDPAQEEAEGPVYDYTKVMITAGDGQDRPPPTEGSGSSVFSVITGPLPSNGEVALVQIVSTAKPPVRLRAGAGMRWLPYPPELGIDMGDLGQLVQIVPTAAMDDYAGSLVLDGDVTIEGWLAPVANPASDEQTLFAFHKPGQTPDSTVSYLLGLRNGVPYAGKGSIVNVADTAIPMGAGWTHLAASFRTQFGIQLGGQRYLDAGANENTKTTDAVTLESWIKLDGLGGKQIVLAKTEPNNGTSWILAVNPDGKLEFSVEQATQTGSVLRSVTSQSVLDIGKWHHVSGVYDVAYTREVAIAFDQGDYVKLPEVDSPPKDGVTVMMWVRRAAQDNGTQQTLFISVDAERELLFNLQIVNGVVGFAAAHGGQQFTISASSALRRDDWVHIAAAYDATRGISLVIDGVPEPQSNAQVYPRMAMPQDGRAQVVGATSYNYTVGGFTQQNTFIGAINEVSLWNRGLDLDEIRQKILQPLASTERGLVGYWKFNDLFGTTVMDVAGTANGVLEGGNFLRIDKGAFAHKIFVDGKMEAFDRVTDPIALSDARVTLGAGYFTNYLQGVISMSRLWNVGQMNWQIDYFMRREIPSNARGLVSAWDFDAGRGGVVFDRKSDNNARILDGRIDLTETIVDAMWVVADFMAGWRFLINGVACGSVAGSLPAGGYGDAQATIGAFALKDTFSRFFTGQISQLRVWASQRSGAQIRGPMHTLLTGKEPKLAAFWGFDEGSDCLIADQTGNGNTGQWIGSGDDITWIVSEVPVGLEPPQVRSAAGDVAKPQNIKSCYAGAAGQYGATRRDARGELYASLMQSLAMIDADSGLLVQGGDFQLGDLILQFVGQVQVDPTLIGYIEGAPPLPAENLKLYPGDPLSYIGASTIFLDETNTKSYSYTASRTVGTTTDVNMQIGFGADSEFSVGLGVQAKTYSVAGSGGLAVQSNSQIDVTGEGLATEELSVIAQKYLESRGGWYPNSYAIDAGVGDIFYPDNIGYALVRSATADLFAMRLEGSGALVGYTAQANPDIPEDMNILMFKIDDQYVKNGTLDGWIGFEPDIAYPNLQPGEKSSYFKPLEAYAIKATIDREQKQRQAYFENFNAAELGQRVDVLDPDATDIADSGQSLVNALIGVKDKASLSIDSWRAKMARRSMVNTYVWTADGGLYSEQQQFMALREETSGGSFSMTAQAGIFTEFSMSPGPIFNLDAMFGTTITTMAQKADHDSALFSLQVDLNGDQRYIGLVEQDEEGELVYSRKQSPGKVRSYRFMSFYRAPSKRNFENFKDGIVDRDWLMGQGDYAGKFDPDALSLRQALTNPNEVWRVMHRVTYVNRTPPTTQNAGQSLTPNVRRPDEESVQSNAIMIAELPINPTAPNPMAQVSVAADALLAQLSQNPVWGADLVTKSADYKEDIMKYMRSFYGIAG
ncbi:LamG-like jellyroll fold domain-containing protein [Yoonia vestfoldensis]|uniref:LamG-like jellyroll fold domain-containing protein n=1 Tax=Yoonia vestfoldensis TaxID=245188 RepID=UPI00035F3D1D|nr:LamG-like jellyroll fold domain-containing protein [Yoonia vestfoldensis]